MGLDANLPPSGNFDLRNWKITLPADASGTTKGTAVEVLNLSGYQNARYFYTGPDGAMVFRAPVDGATTSGSSYARSELREMNGTARAEWKLATGGIMTATLEVDQAPVYANGSLGKVVVGQIHGSNDELVRLYWDNNRAYFVNDQAGSRNSEIKFALVNAAGEQPNISLDERFSYVIDAKGSALEVTVYADGDVYRSVSSINSVWQSDSLYFKAGAYLGVNETQGSGWGQTSFYDLRFNHVDAELVPPTIPQGGSGPVTPPPPPPPPPTETGKTINGTSANNTINGSAGGDTINALSGNDSVYGLGGADHIFGGTGSDRLYGGDGNDHLFGNDGWDTLIGGAGADTLTGGLGGDKFRFDAVSNSTGALFDTIADFSHAQKDTIVLSAIDANGSASGDKAFAFIGTAGFSHSAGELRYEHANGNTHIQGDTNGDGIADLLIMVTGQVAFVSADFVL